MSLAFTFRVPACALDGMEPEEQESFLESLARRILEDATDRAFLEGMSVGVGGRPAGLMHHHGVARRFGSSPGGGPLTGLNTAALARV